MAQKEYWSEKYGELRRPISLRSPWGNLRTKGGQTNFKRYLKSLVSADPFLSSTGRIEWLHRQNAVTKHRIMQKLKEADPEGYRKLKGRIISLGLTGRKKEEMFTKEELDEDAQKGMMAVEEAQESTPGMSLVRLVPSLGLKNLVALCMMAGYTKAEIAKFLRMDEGDLGDINKDDLSNARKDMAKSIVLLADQKVLKDFLEGNVTDRTEMVDRIVARRMKTAIDMHAEERESSRILPDPVRDVDSDRRLAERFGVDRQAGVLVDVEIKKKKRKKEEVE